MKTTNSITLNDAQLFGEGDTLADIFAGNMTNRYFGKKLIADKTNGLQQRLEGTWNGTSASLRIIKPAAIPIGTAFILYYQDNTVKVNNDYWVNYKNINNHYGVLTKIAANRWTYHRGPDSSGDNQTTWKDIADTDVIEIGCNTNWQELIIMR